MHVGRSLRPFLYQAITIALFVVLIAVSILSSNDTDSEGPNTHFVRLMSAIRSFISMLFAPC